MWTWWGDMLDFPGFLFFYLFIGVTEWLATWRRCYSLVWIPVGHFLHSSLIFMECSHVTELQGGKNGWHMSLPVRVAHRVSSTNLLSAQEGEVNRDWGLAAAPHLPRVSGCGRHPITHPYHFAKPAPMSLDMWHEGHSAKWNLQVTHVVLL